MIPIIGIVELMHLPILKEEKFLAVTFGNSTLSIKIESEDILSIFKRGERIMESFLFYKGMSKVYDFLDVIYFKNKNRNPRTVAMNYMNQNDVMILDVCTGTAANAIAIANRYKEARIMGIDISKEMLHIAENKIKKQKIKNIKLYEMNATETTFKDNTFDVILISLILHEVSNEVADKILKEAKRLLKPEGKLLIIEWEQPQSILRKLLFFPIMKLEPKGFKQFLRTDMKSYFERFGLVITKIKHCDYSKVLLLKKIG